MSEMNGSDPRFDERAQLGDVKGHTANTDDTLSDAELEEGLVNPTEVRSKNGNSNGGGRPMMMAPGHAGGGAGGAAGANPTLAGSPASITGPGPVGAGPMGAPGLAGGAGALGGAGTVGGAGALGGAGLAGSLGGASGAGLGGALGAGAAGRSGLGGSMPAGFDDADRDGKSGSGPHSSAKGGFGAAGTMTAGAAVPGMGVGMGMAGGNHGSGVAAGTSTGYSARGAEFDGAGGVFGGQGLVGGRGGSTAAGMGEFGSQGAYGSQGGQYGSMAHTGQPGADGRPGSGSNQRARGTSGAVGRADGARGSRSVTTPSGMTATAGVTATTGSNVNHTRVANNAPAPSGTSVTAGLTGRGTGSAGGDLSVNAGSLDTHSSRWERWASDMGKVMEKINEAQVSSSEGFGMLSRVHSNYDKLHQDQALWASNGGKVFSEISGNLTETAQQYRAQEEKGVARGRTVHEMI